ncbi:DUF4405 domain-containing protein [Desulfobotulus sp. H1]|uniref:DUF4405 domain-containing protein n=1 Tax=Desulfobotulus pelophilus TaxID=2823377 RepID=A0ABT3NAQ6_9BACT|nr:DUF4405 domain-containing protein [Desulfobotulus pelophilus]MCW7754052.1 DUF4405 domain-containing protein [Desulfobotulus pelophilus]
MKSFSIKKWTSLTLFFAFVTASFSGIVLCIMPPGRIAYWLNWKLLGLGKEGWERLYLPFAIIILVLGTLHLLAYNWKLFVSYFRSRTNRKISAELYAALFFFGLVFISAVTEIPPASWILSGVDRAKDSWLSEETRPPFPMAEILSIRDISLRTGIPEERAMQKIREGGMEVKRPEQSIAFIARDNRVSAREIFLMITEGEP